MLINYNHVERSVWDRLIVLLIKDCVLKMHVKDYKALF